VGSRFRSVVFPPLRLFRPAAGANGRGGRFSGPIRTVSTGRLGSQQHACRGSEYANAGGKGGTGDEARHGGDGGHGDGRQKGTARPISQPPQSRLQGRARRSTPAVTRRRLLAGWRGDVASRGPGGVFVFLRGPILGFIPGVALVADRISVRSAFAAEKATDGRQCSILSQL